MGEQMNSETDKFGYSTHALERGLERLMKIQPPYSKDQFRMIRKFMQKAKIWNPFKGRWVIEEHDAELVIENGTVVTVVTSENKKRSVYKPVSYFEKKFSKKCKQMGNARNNKNRYKKDK